MRKAIAGIIAVFFILAGVITLQAADNYTFDADIKAVLQTNGCAGCHDFAQSYSALMTRKSTVAQTSGIPLVNPAKPDSSVIVWRIEGKLPNGTSIGMMPMGGDKLGEDIIGKVRDWIAQGAPESSVAVDDSRKWGEIKSMFR